MVRKASRHRFQRPVLRIHSYILRHRLLVFLALAGIAVACFVGMQRLQWEEDPMALLPDDAVFGPFRTMQDVFRPLGLIAFVVTPADDTGGGASLESAAGALVERLHALKSLHDIQSAPDMASYPRMVEYFEQHRTVYFDEAAREQIEARLKPDAIRESLQNWRRLLMESPAPMMADAFSRDPLGLNGVFLKRLESALGRGSLNVRNGWLRGADEQSIVIWARPDDTSLDSAAARPCVAAIESVVEDVTAQYPVQIAWLSGHRYAVENSSRIKSDITTTVSLATIAIAILSFLVFRRPWFVVLTLLPAAFGGIIAVGFAGWFRPGISGITIGSGSMLIAIAVDYGIHLLFHIDHEQSSSSRIAARLTHPLLLCAGTTLGAFLALQFSALPGHRELGVFAMMGIASAGAFALLVVPLLARRRVSLPSEAPSRWHMLFPRWIQWGQSHRLVLSLVTLSITLVALVGAGRMQFEGDMQALNASTPEIESDLATVQRALGASLEGAFFLTAGSDVETVLEKTARLRTRMLAWQEAGLVNGFRSPAAFLPPQEAQRRAIADWQAFWDETRVAALREDLAREAGALGMRSSAFDSFFDTLVGEAGSIIRLEEMPPTLREMMQTMLLEKDGRILALTTAWPEGQDDVDTMRVYVESTLPQTTILYGPDMAQYVLVLLRSQLFRCGLIALALVVIMVFAMVRKVRRVLALLTPLAVSIVWTFGLLGWAGVTLNIVNALVAVFIFGLVIDYSIFLFTAVSSTPATLSDRDARHLSASAGAVAVSALTTLIGLGSLTVARHPALHTLGLTALIGIAGGWTAVMLLSPLLGEKD